MTSRLDRLFVLLEAGAGPATRRAAARQLGEVQKAHPEELHRLLGRLMKPLRSPAWETRVAAAQAVEAILANVPEWQPTPGKVEDAPETEERPELLKCETFDIERVLQHGALLMGSEGHEYDLEEEALLGTEPKERMLKQRQQVNARLGLDVASGLGLDLSGIYSNEDLCLNRPQTSKTETVRRPVQELVPIASSKPLSSREINLAKRKARQAAFCKQKSRDCSDDSAPQTPPAEPDRKKIKLEPVEDYDVDNTLAVPDCTGRWSESTRWPLEGWCRSLQALLVSGAWEARHGAASALRQLLKAKVSKIESHEDWLEDMALRLLCVLALDRFGDFVSDQVVAPVRETCAQTLGVCLAQMSAERVKKVGQLLALLAKQPQWEARHGAILGFKYLLAATNSTELAVQSGALDQVLQALDDTAEDVSAAAAAALAPAVGLLPTCRMGAVLDRIWKLLSEQDELASPVNSYMSLLGAIMSLRTPATMFNEIDLEDVLPRLWPYLDHSTSSVRKATLQTLLTLTRPLVNRQPKTVNKNNEYSSNKDSKLNNNNVAEDNDASTTNDDESGDIKDRTSNGVDKSDVLVIDDSRNGVNEEEEGSEQYLNWTPLLLQEAMRYMYQRILLEHVHEIQNIALLVWQNLLQYAALGALLLAACPLLSTWLCLAMQPARVPFDHAALLHPPLKEKRSRNNNQLLETSTLPPEVRLHQKWLLGGNESQPAQQRERNVMRARTLAADVLGHLSCYLVQPAPGIEYKADDESPIDCFVKVMVVYLMSGSALQRLVSALVISAWARYTLSHRLFPAVAHIHNGNDADNESSSSSEAAESLTDITKLAPPLLATTLHNALNQALYYDEVALNCNKIMQEARDLVAMMKHYKLPVDGEEFSNMLRLEQVLHMTEVTHPMIASMKTKRVLSSLEQRRANLHLAVTQCCTEQTALNQAVQAALASACTQLRRLPEKLNPVVRPLMESIKKETWEELQRLSADALAALVAHIAHLQPSATNKVLANLKAFLRCDPEVTPRVSLAEIKEEHNDSGSGDSGNEDKSDAGVHQGFELDQFNGILTLWERQREAQNCAPRRGRPPALSSLLHHADAEPTSLLKIQRRGATMAFISLTKHFDTDMPEKLPKLWELITSPFATIMTDEEMENQDTECAEELISRLQVFESVCSHVGAALQPHIRACVPAAPALCMHRLTAVRHMAARALAAMCSQHAADVITALTKTLLPALSDMRWSHVRCGAAEAVSRVVDALQLRVVPYIVLLVVPLLGRMSDPCVAVRLMSTRCFATLVQLMPLDGAANPPPLPPDMQARRDHDRRFLHQLFNPKTIRDYQIPVPVSAELRSYQQAGVNWLRFLYEYKLHGVLCDDMGLGKTLQSIVAMAGSHYERKQAGEPDMPSLVVCPPTLTGHWVFEVNKFISTKYLRPLQYVGPPVERERLRAQVKFYNVIVASYDIVRKDIDFFSSIKWNYCVLDEGHVIKNGKTKAFKAIKQLVASHRLILSGTPIQNNVLELWSLFDFLMPGLLGTERQFTAKYSRPILAARDAKAAPHQLQAGALACEALHRQVLPFLLRRVKEDVLKELPPKITQDYVCDLSWLQRRLYEHFNRQHSHVKPDAHVFQALHYLQNVCNHPKLVLTPDHPEAARVAAMLAQQKSSLDDIEHAAKLPALKQLLLDCGIGTGAQDETAVVSQHRALIFCQLKKMLDIVERDLLMRHLPDVTYLRIDGSVPPQQRHNIVTRFNNDCSIDVLLLTTAVGGLGLNLTGADTVIFVEHDWNPMKDLQAMDRAHRLGQHRVVNVYRLVTRHTLEEKIMGLQKFKMVTANTVISSENAAMETMGTDQLLELFQAAPTGTEPGPSSGKSVLDALPDLWDDRQYEEEYDMTNFIKGLNKIKS